MKCEHNCSHCSNYSCYLHKQILNICIFLDGLTFLWVEFLVLTEVIDGASSTT